MRSELRRGARFLPVLAWLAAVVVIAAGALQKADSPVAPGAAEVVEIAVPSPRVATVAELHVQVGQLVEAGRVVATLKSPSLDADIEVARAELARLQREVEAARAEHSEKHRLNSARLSSDAEGAALDVAQLDAALQKDRAQLAALKEQAARQAELVAQQLVRANELEGLRVEIRALERRVSAARRAVSQARTIASAGKARAEVNGDQSALDAALAPHRLAVRVQEGRLKALEIQREHLSLRAPVTGEVSAVHLRAGAVAPANGVVLALVDARPRKVLVYPDEMWAGQVKVGDRARLVASDGRSGPRTGRVAAVAPRIGPVPPRFRQVPTQPAFGREVHVLLDEQEGAAPLLPGQAFDVVFQGAEPAANEVSAR